VVVSLHETKPQKVVVSLRETKPPLAERVAHTPGTNNE